MARRKFSPSHKKQISSIMRSARTRHAGKRRVRFTKTERGELRRIMLEHHQGGRGSGRKLHGGGRKSTARKSTAGKRRGGVRRHSAATRKKMSKSHKARWKTHGARYRKARRR